MIKLDLHKVVKVKENGNRSLSFLFVEDDDKKEILLCCISTNHEGQRLADFTKTAIHESINMENTFIEGHYLVISSKEYGKFNDAERYWLDKFKVEEK